MKDLNQFIEKPWSSITASLLILFTMFFFSNWSVYAATDGLLTGISRSRTAWQDHPLSFNDSQLLDQELSPLAREDAWRIVEQILVKYPPKDYIYVGLGRSPTLFFAILEILKIENPYIATTFLPLSLRGMSDHIDGRFRTFLKDYILHHTTYDFLRSRQLLVIDFVSSGETLKIVQKLIPDARVLGMSSSEVAHQMRAQNFSMIELEEGPSSLLDFLNGQVTDHYSPYPSLRMADFFTRYNGRMPRPVAVRTQEYMTLINYLARRKNLKNVGQCKQTFN